MGLTKSREAGILRPPLSAAPLPQRDILSPRRRRDNQNPARSTLAQRQRQRASLRENLLGLREMPFGSGAMFVHSDQNLAFGDRLIVIVGQFMLDAAGHHRADEPADHSAGPSGESTEDQGHSAAG